MWSVQDAKSRLSEVLRRARAGEPQKIGSRNPCVVISEDDFEAMRPKTHFGRFLVESAPRGAPMALPNRKTRRGDPFASQ